MSPSRPHYSSASEPEKSTQDWQEPLPTHQPDADMANFLSLLERQLKREEERIVGRLLSWCNLMDALGWCVALDLFNDQGIWLSEHARNWVKHQALAKHDETLPLAALAERIPTECVKITKPGMLLWSPDSSPGAAHPTATDTASDAAKLTRREQEVLTWLRAGKTNPEIAIILGCSVRTIEKHVERIFRKTGVRGRGSWILRQSNCPTLDQTHD